MTPYYADPLVTLYLGDCLEVMPTLEAESVDAVVTDPPYGLEFMGKEWDSLTAKGRGAKVRERRAAEVTPTGVGHSSSKGPYLAAGVDWQGTNQKAMQAWHEQWATEAFRVLKPGGYLLAFGGTRTVHRLASAIEDAGFEIRDCLVWAYASGFPKSLDVSKAIDKIAHVNDETHRRIRLVAEVIRTHREAKGMERADVSRAVVGTPSGACWNWEHHQLPSVEMWPAIKRVLDIPDKFDGLIEGTREMFIGAEREVLRERTMVQGGGSSLELRMGERREVEANVTAPATDLAKQWQGWGTALKPAHEPIVMARKPLVGSVAANVTRYGVGALNIDGSRISTEGETIHGPQSDPGNRSGTVGTDLGITRADKDKFQQAQRESIERTQKLGRWPSNILLSDPELFDEPNPGVVGSGATASYNEPVHWQSDGDGAPGDRAYGRGVGKREAGELRNAYGDSGGYSRFFLIPKADRAERERGLTGAIERVGTNGVNRPMRVCVECGRMKGGAAGNCQCGPTEVIEKPLSRRANVHPTVKPIDLMRHLVKLATPPGGVCLDPFLGSGTTALAASEEGFRCIGIEREADYLEIAKGRLIATPMGLGLDVELVGQPVKQSAGKASGYNWEESVNDNPTHVTRNIKSGVHYGDGPRRPAKPTRPTADTAPVWGDEESA